MAARFSGDVDTVEALFTSGIISMAADACRIVSILAVIAVKNTGLALILLLVLPLFALFTRHVQKRMLAAQLDNRRAVAAVSGQVPETLHNIRTIRALGLEAYREQRYDRCIGEMCIRDRVYTETDDLEAELPHLDVLYMTRIQQERFFNEEEYLLSLIHI